MNSKFILSCLSAALVSLTSCVEEPVFTPVAENQMILSVGFENRVPVDSPLAVDSKTFLSGEKSVDWGSPSQDKVIYVFDSKGAKNVFNAVEPISNGPTRSFAGTISEGSEISYVIWTGAAASSDQCSLENGVFSGSTLKLKNPQNVNNSKSFDNLANIAVMKPGDDALRNVFGYIKYTIPTVEGGTAGAIKSVTFSADEPLAGMVQIDYTGDVPVATIVDDAASTSLTVNTRAKNGELEAGNLYAVLPAGTYTNFNINITLADDTSFDLPATEPVVIERGKYTTAGILPVSDPNAEEEPEQPEEPGVPTAWPNDPTAFDYQIDLNESRVAEYPVADKEAAGITGQGELKTPATLDNITYGGPSVSYYGNRMTIDQVKSTHWSTEYPEVIPAQRYVSFKINRPGAVSFYQSVASADNGVLRVPTYYLALVTTVNGVTSAKIVDQVTPTELTDVRPGNSYAEENLKYHVKLTVSEADMAGITEAATVYVYHRNPKVNTLLVHYYPLTWTSSVATNASDRKPKILLAGDSLVRYYNENEAPQTGWGQCLNLYLGDDVKIKNYAVGGESTKSFMESGKWEEMLRTVLRNDVVLIQFMHNDQKSVETHATDPATTYREYLKKYISDVREKGGVPVLITSMLRLQFGSDGKPTRNHKDYPIAMRAVAEETQTTLIDCEQWSYEWLSELGEAGAEPYFILDKKGGNDNVHVTKEGAEALAKFIAEELIRQGIWIK